MNRLKDILLRGAQKLEPQLVPNGFQFHFIREGKSFGGNFAQAEFVSEDRRLELHFRWSLGLARYHVADQSAFHETYMRELGVWGQCSYPGFSEDPLAAFDELAHDLRFAEDFLAGAAIVLKRAAATEKAEQLARHEDLMAGYVGDVSLLENLRLCYREKRYDEVIKIAQSLKYPGRMSQPEIKMVEISRKRRGV